MLRLDERIPPGDAADLFDHTSVDGDVLDGLRRFLDSNGRPPAPRVVTDVSVARLLEMEEVALGSDYPPLVSLTTFWRIDVRGIDARVVDLARRIDALEGVVRAYAETIATDPSVITPRDEVKFKDQEYHLARPKGIDSVWAWTQAGGGGDGVALVDVEQGWKLDHPDIARTEPLLAGVSDRTCADHGNAALGIAVGRDNGRGGIGVAPTSRQVRAASHFDGTVGPNGNVIMHVANAIAAGAAALAKGDVLLLEVHRPDAGYGPSEVDDADFTAIRLASGNGIVVVEAAGNGGQDLGRWAHVDGWRLTRDDDGDSGAIVVAACTKDVEVDVTDMRVEVAGHRRNQVKNTNFGSRVDCYAWGEGVVTAKAVGYRDDFDGTSSASAIIAGAAMVVQGMYRAVNGTFLTPKAMRTMLRSASGTQQVPVLAQTTEPIGIMPDLRAIGLSIGTHARPPDG